MRIGIDARFLTHPQVGGFKTYTENLIKALGEVDSENSYVIYLDREPVYDLLPQHSNFTYRVVNGTLPVLGMPLREQVGLRRGIRRDDLDLIHFLCNTAPLNFPLRYVITLHDTIQVTNHQAFKVTRSKTTYKLRAMTTYSRWAILNTVQEAARLITVSNYEKSQIIKALHVDPQRVCVTYLAPNSIFVQANEEMKVAWRAELARRFNLPSRFLLSIGYEMRKNIPLLIEIFTQIESRHPDLCLVIVVAKKERKDYFQELVNQRKFNNRIKLLDALPPSDLVKLYNLAEIFIFPSERESFGLPPLEALACGTPTVAMNTTSLPEIIQEGGLLVDGKNAKSWARVIERIITEQDLRSDLVARGLQQAGKLSWSRCAQETVNVYRSVGKAN